jgi:hypothetical protein
VVFVEQHLCHGALAQGIEHGHLPPSSLPNDFAHATRRVLLNELFLEGRRSQTRRAWT